MARALTCDVCRKPTEKIVSKMFLSPVRRGATSHHAKYTHHLDIGSCCFEKVVNGFDWTPRVSAEEYRARRSNGQ